MNIIIFEDQLISNLKPFSLNHASFEVKTGMLSNLDRFKIAFSNDHLHFIVRNEIEDVLSDRYPDLSINPNEIPEGYCINGSIVWNDEYNHLLDEGSSDNNLIFYNNHKDITVDNFFNLESFGSELKNKSNLDKIDYLWDAIDFFPKKMNDDFNFLKVDKNYKFSTSSYFVSKEKISIDESVVVKPGCIFDATKGPIVIKENSVIDIGSKIQGPVYIDKDVFVSSGAKIKSGTLIGPGCKVGGEISNTIFHAYSNKVHDGFLGHSYVGEWVNIGAGTNNSNLKNNYSSIKFTFKDKTFDTNRIFLGSMIGDFTRIGISSMLNTGTYIGIGSNIFGGDFQKIYIKSFSWGKDSRVDFNKFIDTCIKMKKRRNEHLSDNEKELLEKLYNSF